MVEKTSDNKLNQNTFGVDNTSFEYEVESYLEHHAVKFQNVFDANLKIFIEIKWIGLILPIMVTQHKKSISKFKTK